MSDTAVNRPSLLVLVRHGQSERNVVKKRNHFYLDDESRKSVKGVPDHLIPLTEDGRRQAAVTGQALRETFGTFDYVFHSGYTRTIETAEHLLAAYPDEERARMTVRHHLFIRERDGGHTYDMTDAEASAAFPWLQDYWSTFGPFFARPPGGESLAQVCERVYAFLQKVARTMAGKRVLVVSHAGTMWCLRYVLEGWTYEEADRRFSTEPMPNCWDYPAAFYARLAQHWPTLAFAASVNGEMGDFGGILLARDGTTENLVRDYDADYDRRAHKRQIARGLLGWMAFLTEGRDFRLMPDAAWKQRSMPFDAHFDGDFWFYFRSREEMVAFRRRYKSAWTMRRIGKDWKRVRITG